MKGGQNIIIEGLPNDQFLCPKCENIPEIKSINVNNGHIELYCTKHGKMELTIQGYYKSMKDSSFTYINKKCEKCNERNKNEILSYCYYCQKDLCDNCLSQCPLFHRENAMGEKLSIKIHEKSINCLQHIRRNLRLFCLDCVENLCNDFYRKAHEGHDLIEFFILTKDINKYKKIIKEKNKVLSDVIKFNEILLNTYENYPNNYFHIKSLINIGKTFEKGNLINYTEFNYLINKIDIWLKEEKEAVEKLKKKSPNEIILDGNEEDFKLISQKKFEKLKHIDLAGKKIKNIEPLKKMDLKYLEYLNLSNNIIEDVSPIQEIRLRKLKELCLQKNMIENIEPLLKCDFPEIEILRIEENPIDKSTQSFMNLQEKYKNKMVHIKRTLQEFNKKYNTKISSDSFIMIYQIEKEVMKCS